MFEKFVVFSRRHVQHVLEIEDGFVWTCIGYKIMQAENIWRAKHGSCDAL